MVCLCAPTSHEGSFRCRLHRATAPYHPTANPSQSAANHHQGRGFNFCSNSTVIRPDQETGCSPPAHPTLVRESSSSTSTRPAALHRPSNDLVVRFSQFSHAQNSNQNWFRSRSSATSASQTLSSPSSTSRWSLSSYRSAPAASRAAASSSSPSPSSPPSYTRPPPAKRSPSSPPAAKSSYGASTSPPLRCGTTGSTTSPSASHAAAMAILKQHSLNKQGVRNQFHNRSMLSPTSSSSKIGPSRLSRMAVASADPSGVPLLRDEQCMDSIHPPQVPGPSTVCSAETAVQRGFTVLETAPPAIRLNTRAAMTNFKQMETACRIVGSKGESLIMPAVY